MDRNWSHRSTIYKFCLVLLIIGIGPFLLGFSAPDWLFLRLYAKNGTVQERSFGLWEWCEGNTCHRNPSVGNEVVEDWFIVVVILQTVSLLVYIVSLSMAALQNFARIRWIRTLRVLKLRELLHRDSETPEDLGFVSGFLSFAGILLFTTMTADIVSQHAYYSWGFAMAFAGASIPVITGLLMCKAHTVAHIPPPPQAEPTVVHMLNPMDNQDRRPEAAMDRRRLDRQRNRRTDRHLQS
ncbi:hypothetical protein ElyMa_006815500 [Elysia marginata]|uniref:G-protein coupled receptors family 3 profile domain-containing protein n=1 Tax=Elysia marginata TaxID=1093978 RepID=A0AAV4J323_9GAST|nr:hypothetical protein ElyMa_006815500 [Elysia marginata]